jgi:hypothetical protein
MVESFESDAGDGRGEADDLGREYEEIAGV